MRFKTPDVQASFKELEDKNNRLHELANLIDSFCFLELKKDICLTQVFRTQEEQTALYKETPNPPTTSPHMVWHAFDIRSSDFNDKEIQRILGFANQFTYGSGQKKVAIYHEIAGNVMHFHVQYF